jgi:uncharacterized protein YndB with AHSA1/START domain
LKEPTVIHTTFVIERDYPAPPERVFTCFADPAKKRRWFGEERGMTVESFEMDFRVGGHDCLRFRFKEGTPFPGAVMVNHTTYQDIVPDRRIVLAYTMTLAEKRISASLSTFDLLGTESGTNLVFTEQAAFFEGADGPERRQEGWRKLLEKLGGELAR